MKKLPIILSVAACTSAAFAQSAVSISGTVDLAVRSIPFAGDILARFIHRFKRGLKGLLYKDNLFVDLGFTGEKRHQSAKYQLKPLTFVKRARSTYLLFCSPFAPMR